MDEMVMDRLGQMGRIGKLITLGIAETGSIFCFISAGLFSNSEEFEISRVRGMDGFWAQRLLSRIDWGRPGWREDDKIVVVF